jgi:hypothetical protein
VLPKQQDLAQGIPVILMKMYTELQNTQHAVSQLRLFGDNQPKPGPVQRNSHGDEENWYEQTHALLVRHFGGGESVDQICKARDIPFHAAQSRIAQMRKIPIGCQCLKDFDSGSRRQDRYPRRFQQNYSAEMASQIAKRFAVLAPKHRNLFEHAIEFYVENLAENQRIMLGVRDWEQHFAGKHCARLIGVQNVIQMIRELKIDGLRVDYFGYLDQAKQPDISHKLQAIGAPRGSKVTFVRPPNRACKTNHEQLGISIHNRVFGAESSIFKASHAFRKVAAMALVRRIWLTSDQ